LTILLDVPVEVSEARRLSRQRSLLDVPPAGDKAGGKKQLPFNEPLRDRMEEADREFFERVQQGFHAIAAAEPDRVRIIDATRELAAVTEDIWRVAAPLFGK
jgi:thymidylate kinase